MIRSSNWFDNIRDFSDKEDIIEYGFGKGDYFVECIKCRCHFVGDKRAYRCYDCSKEMLDGRGDLIDVWKISTDGTYYYDNDIDGILIHVNNMETDDTVFISKVKMGENEYNKMKDFDGF
jgi:hypothetical protein